MKRYILTILAAVMLVPSCNLDEQFYTYLDADTYIQDAASARKVLYGLYRNLCNQDLYGDRLSIKYDLPTDISKVDGTSLANNRDFCCNAHMATNSWVQNTWRQLYDNIYDCADFIERSTAALENMDEANRKITEVYIAEARTIRALMYFELVRNWKNITLVKNTKEAAAHASTFKQNDPVEVYEYIEKELTEAAEVIPWATQDTVRPGNDHMVSKASALGLLARVYTTWAGYPLQDETKWLKAKEVCEQIITSGKHDLLEDYEKLWDNVCNSKWDPTESLWEVSFYSPSISSNSASNCSGLIGKWNGVYVVTNTTSIVRVDARYRAITVFGAKWPNPELDRRRDLSIAEYYYEGTDSLGVNSKKDKYFVDCGIPGVRKVYKTRGGTTPITLEKVSSAMATTSQKDAFRDGFYVAKYDLTKYVDPSRHLSDGNYSNANWYILRYADVLLMYAEAINEISGPTQEAYDAINKVRRRAYGMYRAIEKEEEELPDGEGTGTEGEAGTEGGTTEGTEGDAAEGTGGEVSGGTEGGEGTTEGGTEGEGTEGEEEPTEPEFDYSLADLPSGLDQEGFRQAIRKERAYELCFEGNRKQDLIRWGIYAASIAQADLDQRKWNPECPHDYYLAAKHTTEGKHELQPIPQRELDLMPEYDQNPNWGN